MLEELGRRGARGRLGADEALEALNGETPDVLVSDIGMPRDDGYELMRRVRAMELPARRDLPAIALTAFARHEDAAKARQAGYGVHLPKPVDPSRLFVDDCLGAVRRLLTHPHRGAEAARAISCVAADQ